MKASCARRLGSPVCWTGAQRHRLRRNLNICPNILSTKLAAISFGERAVARLRKRAGVPLSDWKIAGAAGRSAVSAGVLLLALIAVAAAPKLVMDQFSTTPSAVDSAPKSLPPSTSEQGSTWADLTKTQQATLQPLKSTWSRFDPARKQRWLQTATNLTKLSKQEQARAASRMTAWASLTTLERTRARVHFICAKGYKAAHRERSTAVATARGNLSVPAVPLEVVGPAAIRLAPGATTLMLSQISQSNEAFCPPQIVASLTGR